VPHLRLTIVALCLTARVAGAADAGVHVYLQPLPAPAVKLSFAIASVAVLTSSGSEFPLKVSLGTVSARTASRQRLLASGRVPVGAYVGFVVTVGRAALKGEHGDIALALPDTTARIDVPFDAAGPQGSLVGLTLRYDASVPDGASFMPVFTATMPSRPIADRVGLVTNAGSNTITVFDKSLDQAVTVIDTCAGPAGMALDQRRRRAYVACSRDDEIQAIDLAASDQAERVRLFPGDGPRELALTPDGATLLAVNARSNSLAFFDAATLARQERVNVGSGAGALLIEATGRRAFVFNRLASSVSVIDIPSRTVAATISTESAPLRGQFNVRGDRLYVIHERSPFMTVLDARQLTIITRARVRTGISAIAVDRVRDLVYLAGTDDATVECYDPNALVPINVVKSRSGSSYLAIDAQDNSLYMVSAETASVVVAGLVDRKIHAEIDVGDDPYWVVVMGEK